MKLRWYQFDQIKSIKKAWVSKIRRLIMQLATGGGKTVMFTFMAKQAIENGNSVLIITDRKELLKQAGSTFLKFGLTSSFLTAKQKTIPNGTLCVAMSETIKRRLQKPGYVEFIQGFKLIVFDECFPAETKIGEIDIKDIKVGDFVDSFNHNTKKIEQKKVLHKFEKESFSDMVSLKYLHVVLHCTKEHPIFVKNKGYVSAKDVKLNDYIYVRSHFKTQRCKFRILPFLQKRNNIKRYWSKKNANTKTEKEKKWKSILLKTLCLGLHRDFIIKKDEIEKSNVKPRNKKKSIRYIKENWTQAKDSRWKWSCINSAAKSFISRVRKWMVSRINYNNWKWLLALSLQNRYWKPRKKNINRNKWWISFKLKSKKSRFKKDNFIRFERVSSINIYKSGNHGKCEDGSKGNIVYNLEIEDNNNYFANGVLVHNCHKRSFDKIFAALTPNQYVIGATATPDRAGFKSPLSDYYECIIEGVPIADLIEQKFLLPAVYYGLQLDFSQVKLKSGEFDEKAISEYYDKNQVFSNVVENYQKLTPNTKALLFASSVKDSERVRDEFLKVGISARSIDAESTDRDQILEDFKQGKFLVLCSVDILTTGYDEPSIETIILFRATMRITLFLQMCGRGSRIFEGLDHFNIIDCGGNINRHEFWCSDREWSLLPPKKKKKKQGPAIIKECPNCKALIPAGSKKCKYCGFEYPATSVEQMEIILQRLNPKEQKEWLDAATVEELENYRIAKGFKMGWILYKFTEKNQFFTYQKLRNYKNGWAWYKYKEFVNVCDCCGSEFLGQKHKVYNENNELQDGLISCGACVVEEVISN